jgi:hypothetical protein
MDERGDLQFVIQSPDFPEVPMGEEIPVCNPVFEERKASMISWGMPGVT